MFCVQPPLSRYISIGLILFRYHLFTTSASFSALIALRPAHIGDPPLRGRGVLNPSMAFQDMQIHLMLERNSGSHRRFIRLVVRIAHGPAPQLTLTLFTQQKCGTMLPSPSHPPLRTLYGLCSAKIPVTTVRMFAVSGVLQDGPSRSCTVRGEGRTRAFYLLKAPSSAFTKKSFKTLC